MNVKYYEIFLVLHIKSFTCGIKNRAQNPNLLLQLPVFKNTILNQEIFLDNGVFIVYS